MNRSKFKRSVVDYSLLNAEHPSAPPNEHFMTALGHKALVRFGIAHSVHSTEAVQAGGGAVTQSGLKRAQLAASTRDTSVQNSSRAFQSSRPRPPASPFMLMSVGGYCIGDTPPPASAIPPSPALPPSAGSASLQSPAARTPTALKQRFARHTAASAQRASGGVVTHTPPRRRDTAAGVADTAAQAVVDSNAAGTPARVSAAERAIALSKAARRTATMHESRFQSLMVLAADSDDEEGGSLLQHAGNGVAESKASPGKASGRGLLRSRPPAIWRAPGTPARTPLKQSWQDVRLPPPDAFHLDAAGREAAEALVSAGADVRATIQRAKENLEAVLANTAAPSTQAISADTSPGASTSSRAVLAAAGSVGAAWQAAFKGGHGPISKASTPLHAPSVLYERNQLTGRKTPLIVVQPPARPGSGAPSFAVTHSPSAAESEHFAETYGVDLQLLYRAQAATKGGGAPYPAPPDAGSAPPLVGQSRFSALQQLGMQAGKTAEQYESAVPKGMRKQQETTPPSQPSLGVSAAPPSNLEHEQLGPGTSGVLAAMRARVDTTSTSAGPLWGGDTAPNSSRITPPTVHAHTPPTAAVTAEMVHTAAVSACAADDAVGGRKAMPRPAWDACAASSPQRAASAQRQRGGRTPSPINTHADTVSGSPRRSIQSSPRRRPPSTPPAASRRGGAPTSAASTASVHASLAEAAASTAAMAARTASRHSTLQAAAAAQTQVEELDAQLTASNEALQAANDLLARSPQPSPPAQPPPLPSTSIGGASEPAPDSLPAATTTVCLQLELEAAQLQAATVGDLISSVAEALGCEPLRMSLPSGTVLAPPEALLSALGVPADVTLHVTVPANDAHMSSPQSPGDSF